MRAGSRAPDPTTIAGTFAVSLGLVALVGGSTGSVEGRLWTTAVGSAVVGGGCLALMRPHVRKEGAPLLARLGPATVVLYTLGFGVLGIAWLAPQAGGRQVIDPAQIPGGMAVSMVGLVALTVGYVIGPPRGLARGARRVMANIFPAGQWSLRVPSMAILLYAVGTAARGFRLSTGQFGYLQDAAQTLSSPSPGAQVLSLLQTLTTIALVAAAIDHFILHRSVRSRVVLMAIATAEISIGLFSASKEGVLFTLVALALVKAFSSRQFRVGAIIAAGVLVSLLFPFTAEYRITIRAGDSGQIAPTAALSEIPATVGQTAESATLRSVVVDGPSEVARRIRQVDNVALVRQKTPETIPYRPWTQLVTGPAVATVPRALWPSKPIVSTGREFAQDYYELPPSVYSANAVTVPGDLLRHGGILPLAVGLGALGLVLRFFDVSLSPMADPRRLIIYVPVFLHLIKLESDVTVFVIGLVQLLAFAALTSWLVFAPKAPSSRHVETHQSRRARHGTVG